MKTTEFQGICFPKRLILLFLLFTLCIACNQRSEKGIFNEVNQDVDPIEGVWELTNQYWVKDGDTLLLGPDEIPVKHKIYLDGYVIWTNEPSFDSLEWHGYGTYSLTNDTLIEKFISMSLLMKEEMGSEDEVIFQIEFDKDYCKQATNSVHRGTIYLSVEEWKKLNRRTNH
jgi:hypothetical protein